jgi:hypothetical protein
MICPHAIPEEGSKLAQDEGWWRICGLDEGGY